MTNEELAILLPQINNLINAYEQGARKQLVRSDIKTVEAYALSLHMSPIQSMRFAMNTMDAVSLTPEEMESEYRAQTQSASNIETRSATKEFVDEYLFESECEIVGGDEFSDTEKIVGKDIKLGSQKIPSKLGYKLTNPVRVKVNLKPLQKMQETIEENSGKTLAECFDCNVVYTVDVMYPSIEVLWEFEKLLKGLLDAIKVIETNLSSAQMYSDICKMKAFVGTNFLCPSMMTKINLMLPTLFMKYSLDLAKISMDLNFVLGGIFKVAISMIATFLENIRALIIPFVDCTIGAAKAVGGYIRSVAASISQGVDATTDIVNKAAQVVHKTALLVGEVFSEDPAGVFDRTKPIYKSLEDLKQQHLEAQDELAQLIAKFNENVVPKEVVDAEQSLSKSQFLLNALPVEYGGYYSGHLKENPIIKMCKKFYNDNFGDKRISTQYWNFWELGPQEFQEVLVNFFYAYMFIYLPEDFSFSVGGEAAFFEESEAIELKLSSLEKEIIEKKKELAKTVREIHRDSKDSLSYKMTQREKKIRDWSQGLDKSQVKPGENTMQEWLKTRYSVDIGNSYVDHEYAYLKTANRIGKAPSNFLYGAEQLLNKYVVGTLEDIKKYVNDFFGNIINALKNLNIMLEQNTFSQFSILGEIMQLVHIIRAFNLIKKLVDEGFEGCDKLSESKAQEKILKDALEEISEGKISAKVISKNNAETGSQDFYLNTYSKKSKFNHITDLKDCSDSASLLRKRNLNTDQLYDMMKESMV